MNGFKKLVLASAVLAATSGAYAMEALDDESMSTTTGQDGLTITLDSSIADLQIKYVDRDGLSGTSFDQAGALVIGDTTSGVDVSILGLQIDIDVGGNLGTAATGSGMLNIGIGLTSLNIGLGNVVIGVADASNTAGSSSIGTVKTILAFDASAALNIAGNANLMNIQLGNETQGSMVHMSATLGSITLTGLSIEDNAGTYQGGAIRVGTLRLSNVVLVNDIDAVAGGLQIRTAGSSIGEVGLEQVRLGDSAQASIGDVYLVGLDANSTITVTGH